MDLNDLSDNIYYALKSLYRYGYLVDSSGPQILIDNEVAIMKQRFANLNVEELHIAFTLWPEFAKKQAIDEERQQVALERDFERYLNSIN